LLEDLGLTTARNKLDLLVNAFVFYPSFLIAIFLRTDNSRSCFIYWIRQISYILIIGTYSVCTITLFRSFGTFYFYFYFIFFVNELGINAKISFGNIEFTLAISITCICLDCFTIYFIVYFFWPLTDTFWTF
jgi:hypothetical protein